MLRRSMPCGYLPARRLREAGFDVEGFLLHGDPDDVTGAHVENGIGLLVMGAYGHSRIRSLIVGSTTEAMVRLCKIRTHVPLTDAGHQFLDPDQRAGTVVAVSGTDR